jgi:hypothetical protein
MRRLLIAVGLVVVLTIGAVLAYGVWFLRRVVGDQVKVAGTARVLDTAIEIEVVVSGSEDGVVITEIDAERSVSEALGLHPPDGFSIEALRLEEREKGDARAEGFVATFNREKVRYTGRRVVTPATPAVLRFPADRPQAGSGEIRLQHERQVGMGGSMGFLSVKIGP